MSAPEIEIRAVRPEEHEALGALTAAAYGAYDGGQPLSAAYAEQLADVAGRASSCAVLVAVDVGGELLGGLTVVPDRTSPFAEHDLPSTGSFRHLAVAPAAQGRGVGRALIAAALDRARAGGDRQVLVHVAEDNERALDLYVRLGFARRPDLDWEVAEGVEESFWLRALLLDLTVDALEAAPIHHGETSPPPS